VVEHLEVLRYSLTPFGFRFRHIITKAESLAPPPETGGGVLADEMGMGKSLSILALITKTLENAHVWAGGSDLAPSNDLSDAKYRSRGTLIVASSGLLLNNWNFEIDKHLDRTLKITKYHGQKRETQIHVLADSDIVLTTYHTLAADFAAKRSPNHDIGWFRVVLDEGKLAAIPLFRDHQCSGLIL
jgi:SWI/SNF-related matrix-associated actin-dependent regulator of chromatin subfamily A3